MDEPIINRIEHQANCIPDYEQMLRGRTLLCTGTQLPTDNMIWSVIKNIVERVNAGDRELSIPVSILKIALYKVQKQLD